MRLLLCGVMKEDYSDEEVLNEVCANIASLAQNFYPIDEFAEQYVDGLLEEQLNGDKENVLQCERNRAVGVLNTAVDTYDYIEAHGVDPKARAERSLDRDFDWEWYDGPE